ncbi:unnamed protein product [Jaminaea pallidilutea]
MASMSSAGVLRRDSNSSTSSSNSSSSTRRVRFDDASDSDSDHVDRDPSSSLPSRSSSSSSIYASHSANLHSTSRQYSTSDGSLPLAPSCPWDACTSSDTCSACRKEIQGMDLSLKRFGR